MERLPWAWGDAGSSNDARVWALGPLWPLGWPEVPSGYCRSCTTFLFVHGAWREPVLQGFFNIPTGVALPPVDRRDAGVRGLN